MWYWTHIIHVFKFVRFVDQECWTLPNISIKFIRIPWVKSRATYPTPNSSLISTQEPPDLPSLTTHCCITWSATWPWICKYVENNGINHRKKSYPINSAVWGRYIERSTLQIKESAGVGGIGHRIMNGFYSRMETRQPNHNVTMNFIEPAVLTVLLY
jgi:hypothetical protein